METHDATTNAQTYAAARQDMSRRYERVVLALSILRQLNDIDDPTEPLNTLYTRIVETVAFSMAAENCSIMLKSADGKTLELRSACSPFEEHGKAYAPHAWQGKRYQVGEGIVGAVAGTGEPRRVEDTSAHPEFSAASETGVAVGSIMCFPLKMEQRVIGVLNLSHSQPGFFTVESEKTLELVAERCSSMIHARLQNQLLKESEEYYRLITENAADGIVVFGLTGRVMSVNPAVVKITGFPTDDWLTGAVSWDSRVHPDHRASVEAYRARILSANEPATETYSFIRADGRVIVLEQRSAPLSHASYGRRGYVSVIREVTNETPAPSPPENSAAANG